MTNNQLSILLVDDNDQYLERLNDMLREMSEVGKVLTAGNYEDAKQTYAKHIPDIVLLDIHLPGKSGIELLKYFKHLEQPCPVMMISNQADEYYRNLCSALGADYFIDKTIDFMKVPEIILKMKNR